jgi:hypothetical protein
LTCDVPTLFQAAVEGDLDEAVLRRAARHVGGDLGNVYGRDGKGRLKANIGGYNNAARRAPWVVLVDLDHDHPCAPPLCDEWLANPSRGMCFRVAVRQVEAWLLADAEEAARFLSVSRARIPSHPESLSHPKHALVQIAEGSRRRAIREGLVPERGSGRVVGRLYNPLLRDFVRVEWRPEVAAERADSLRRCLDALRRLRRHAESNAPS